MPAIKVEAYVGQPPCPGCRELEALCHEMQDRFGGALDLHIFKGVEGKGRMEAHGLKIVPALIFEGLIRIEGVCPSRETFLKALNEFGLNL